MSLSQIKYRVFPKPLFIFHSFFWTIPHINSGTNPPPLVINFVTTSNGLSHFQTRKRNYIWHEWSLVTFKIRGVLCPTNEKRLPLRKATVSTSRSKQREVQRENKLLFNNPWVFDVFVSLPAIIMQYLYDSV